MDRSKRIIRNKEMQLFQSGEKRSSAYETCAKRDKHAKYIDVSQIQEHFLSNDALREFVTIRCNLTVMIEVETDKGTRCGSGFIQKIEIVNELKCPCPICKINTPVNKYAKVTVSTALHMLDEEDGNKSKARLFYDNPDSFEQWIYGVKSHSRDVSGDWCALVCVSHVTDMLTNLKESLSNHWTLGRKLKEEYQLNKKSNLVIVVAHPHGGPKRVSIGKEIVKDLTREVRDDQDWCFYCYDATTCDGSSGGPVYVLGKWNDGFGYWFGHAHNHCGIDHRNYSSSTIGVDSTYGQVTRPYSSITIDDRDNLDETTDTLVKPDVISATNFY